MTQIKELEEEEKYQNMYKVKAYKFQMIEEKNMVRCTASWWFCSVRTKKWCVISTKWFLSDCDCRQRFTNSFVVKIVFVAMVTYGCLIFGEHGYANKKRGQIYCLEQNELFSFQGMLYKPRHKEIFDIGQSPFCPCIYRHYNYINERSHGENLAGSVAKSHRSKGQTTTSQIYIVNKFSSIAT